MTPLKKGEIYQTSNWDKNRTRGPTDILRPDLESLRSIFLARRNFASTNSFLVPFWNQNGIGPKIWGFAMVDVFYRFWCKNTPKSFLSTEIERGGLGLSKTVLGIDFWLLDQFLFFRAN